MPEAGSQEMIKPHEPIKRSVITQQEQVVKQARGYCPSSQRTGTALKSLPGNHWQGSFAWPKVSFGEAQKLGGEEWANVAFCLLSVFLGDKCLKHRDLESNCHVSKLSCL